MGLCFVGLWVVAVAVLMKGLLMSPIGELEIADALVAVPALFTVAIEKREASSLKSLRFVRFAQLQGTESRKQDETFRMTSSSWGPPGSEISVRVLEDGPNGQFVEVHFGDIWSDWSRYRVEDETIIPISYRFLSGAWALVFAVAGAWLASQGTKWIDRRFRSRASR